jgi:MFS family permease
MTLLPAVAASVPGGGAHTLGVITGVGAGGALLGALYLAKKATPLLGRVVGVASVVFAFFLIVLSFAHSLALILVVAFFSGIGLFLQMGCANTIIQSMVSDEKRGRVLSFFNFALLGVAPFGSLLIGALAQKFGLAHTFLLDGVLCLIGALFFCKFVTRINQQVAARIGVAA